MAEKKDYVVLVVTKMKDDRLCSMMLDVVSKKMHRAQFQSVVLSQSLLDRIGIGSRWEPGAVIEMVRLGAGTLRITHPEDSIFSLDNIVLKGRLREDDFLKVAEIIHKKSMRDIFGMDLSIVNNKHVIESGMKVASSVGCIQVAEVVFSESYGKLRCSFYFNGEHYDIPVTAKRELDQFQRRDLSLHISTVVKYLFVGIANPYSPPAWATEQEYCFLQLDGVIY